MKPTFPARIGATLFLLGILLGAWLNGASTWAQFEASLFDADMVGNSELPMQCPRFIATDETGIVAVTLHNPTEKDHSRFIRTHISAGYVTLMHEDARLVDVAAGESLTLQWPFTAKDAVYNGRMVFVRSFVVGRAPLPSASNGCGVYVLQHTFGLSGMQFALLISLVSLLLMGSGFYLWKKGQAAENPRVINLQRGMWALAVSVVVGLGLMFAGEWFFAAIALLVTVLLAVSMLTPILLR